MNHASFRLADYLKSIPLDWAADSNADRASAVDPCPFIAAMHESTALCHA